MTDSVVSQFGLTASDGEHIAVMEWPLPEEQSPQAVALVCHGLGEHIWRYNAVAQRLNSWGMAVRGMDWYGHGESGGPRGGMPHKLRFLDDLADLVDDTRRMYPNVPLVLVGHSMGGLVAADFVRHRARPVQGLVMTSPALAVRLNPIQRLLMSFAPRLAPNFRVDNGLPVAYLCRTAAVREAYVADKLVHRKVCGRLAEYVYETGTVVREAAGTWDMPTLLMYAGDDHLVDPQGSIWFAQAAATNPQSVVQAQAYAQSYHELFNEPNAEDVLQRLHTWLKAQKFIA
jgi:alpha-beta hydrolase superfamily lysophospholipase